jgi:hypothetical protein
MNLFILKLFPNLLKFSLFQRPYICFSRGSEHCQYRKIVRESQNIANQFFECLLTYLWLFANYRIDLASSRRLCHIIDRFSFGEIKLWDLAGWLLGYGFGEEGALG